MILYKDTVIDRVNVSANLVFMVNDATSAFLCLDASMVTVTLVLSAFAMRAGMDYFVPNVSRETKTQMQ